MPRTPLFVGSGAPGSAISKQKKRSEPQQIPVPGSIQGMSNLKMFNEGDGAAKDGGRNETRASHDEAAAVPVQCVFLEIGFALFSTAVAMGVAVYRWPAAS